MAQLKLEDVSLFAKTGSQPILDSISTEIFAGDRVAIVGPSGAGKTSLLRLLNRLAEASRGHIYFEDRDIGTIPVLELRRQITLVLQESRLLDMTVQEALAYPLRLRKLSETDIRQRLTTWMDALNLPSDWLSRREVELSVGQRQLVAIARALLLQPKVLLLDEPTSALDAGRGTQVINLFRQLSHDQATTILMVNHQLEFAQEFSSRVFYVQQGRLVSDRPAEQVNWQQVKDNLVRVELQDIEEWGED